MFVCSVEKLLSMCSSSCLPGGGSNTELALHCLHYCQGNTMVILSVCLSVCVLHSVLYRALIPSFSPFLHPSSLTSMHHYSQTLSSFLPSIISFSFFLSSLSSLLPSSQFTSEPLHASSLSSPPSPSLSPVQATLEMLLFSQPSPTGDYHYSGKPLTFDLTLPNYHMML